MTKCLCAVAWLLPVVAPKGVEAGPNLQLTGTSCDLLFPYPQSCTGKTGTDIELSSDLFTIEVGILEGVPGADVLLKAVDRYKELFFYKTYHRQRNAPLEPHMTKDDWWASPMPPQPHPPLFPATAAAAPSQLHTLTIHLPSAEVAGVGVKGRGAEKKQPSAVHYKTLGVDESYNLTVTGSPPTAALHAATVWGALYGLEAFSQLLEYRPKWVGQQREEEVEEGGGKGWRVRGVPLVIEDHPRFPWRGLMLDSANHFLSVAALKRSIDGMLFNKLNALHWHIVDSYSFPWALKGRPRLAEEGAWAVEAVYSASDVQEVQEYARQRGVRVVVEVDAPGHAFAWGLAYPEVTVQCRSNQSQSDIGLINDAPFDPSQPLTYALLGEVIGEATQLFSDGFMHVGGDELQLGCWETPAIRKWMAAEGLETLLEAQEFFQRRLLNMTAKHGVRAIVWEETFQQVPEALQETQTVVEVWENASVVAEALSEGFDVLLADGWYLDRQAPVDWFQNTTWFWLDTWRMMHDVEPDDLAGLPQDGSDDSLRPPRGKLLGGEAAMWSEQVSDKSLDARVWPRACAVAERLWSGKGVRAQLGQGSKAPYAPHRLAKHRCRMAGRGVPVGPIWADYCSADLVPLGQQAEEAPSAGFGQWLGVLAASALLVYAGAVDCLGGKGSGKGNEGGKVGGESVLRQPLLDSSTAALAAAAPTTAGAGSTGKASGGEGGDRLHSLDVFRGLTVALMIFVDNVGDAFPAVDHCPWDGMHLADLVVPFFDFMVGVSLALSTHRASQHQQRRGGRWAAGGKVFWRFVRLFILGLVVQGGLSSIEFKLSKLRVMGILQRVAVCYLTAALCEILLPPSPSCPAPATSSSSSAAGSGGRMGWLQQYKASKWQWLVAAGLLLSHTCILYGVPVPTINGQQCGRGVLTPPCNAATYVDKLILGVDHMYFPTNGGNTAGNDVTFQRLPACSSCSPGKCVSPPGAPWWCEQGAFDPEGFVSSLTCVIASIVGLHFGHVVVAHASHAARLRAWLPLSLVMLVAGLVLHLSGAVPHNTDLYSCSFLLTTTGISGLTFSAIYWLIDDKAAPAAQVALAPMRWLGLNAIAIFALAEGDILDIMLGQIYWDNPDQSLANVLWPTGVYWGPTDEAWKTRVVPSHDPAIMAWTLAYIGAMCLVALALHKHKIYFKI